MRLGKEGHKGHKGHQGKLVLKEQKSVHHFSMVLVGRDHKRNTYILDTYTF